MKCSICNKSFSRSDNYIRHMKTVHKDTSDSLQQSESDDPVEEDETEEEQEEQESGEASESESNHEDDIISDKTINILEGLLSAADIDAINLTKQKIREFVYKNENFVEVPDFEFEDEEDIINLDSISMLKAVVNAASDGNFNLSITQLNEILNNLKAK